MRKLVTIRKIDNILPITNADAIEVAVIGGWNVVVKKGDFRPSELCVYFELDSFLPDGNSAWQFLVDKQSCTFEGRKGHRLRTIKLRGVLSQGFIVPIDSCDVVKSAIAFERAKWGNSEFIGREDFDIHSLDFSEVLGVVKWEAAIPAELAGQVEGSFPTFIPKTDQERCQNIIPLIFESNVDSQYEVSMKLDGTSCTIYHKDGKFGVCSRNWELKINDENKNNTLVRIAHDTLLNAELPKMGNFAIQGELMGPGIQGNRECLKMHQLFIFDVYDIDKQQYLTPSERANFVNALQALTANGCGRLWHVPVLGEHRIFTTDTLSSLARTLLSRDITTIDQLLQFAEGQSLSHTVREGLVFKRVDGKFSFKVISNRFLLSEK